jgi:hypothetical protein
VTPLFEEREDLTMEVGERSVVRWQVRGAASKEREIHIRSGENVDFSSYDPSLYPATSESGAPKAHKTTAALCSLHGATARQWSGGQ